MPGASGFQASSKLLEKKWQERQYNQHRQKVKGMKHGLDNQNYQKYPHMSLRLKKIQKEEERQSEIEHDNRVLLQKMTTIMKHKGRVDNWNEYEMRSRNKHYRDRQLEKIEEENRGIAKRLENVKPLYDTSRWEDDYKRHHYYLELWAGSTKDYELTPRSPRKDEDEYEDDFESDDEDKKSRKLPKIDSSKGLVGRKSDHENDKKRRDRSGKHDESPRSRKGGGESPKGKKGSAPATPRNKSQEQNKLNKSGQASSGKKGDAHGVSQKKGKDKSDVSGKGEKSSTTKKQTKKGNDQSAKGKSKGTVKEDKNFNPESDVEKLHNAMKGFGTDEQPLIDILSKRNNSQRQTLKKKYKEKYDKDLTEELKSELSGDFEELILALMMTPGEYDAYCLYHAMKGLGTDEAALIGILCSRNAKELNTAKSKYKEMYKKELEEDVIDDTSGHFKELLVQLLKSERDKSTSVNQKEAEEDVASLFKDGKFQPYGETFKNMLCQKGFAQLQAIYKEFEKSAGRSIEDAIEKNMFGDDEACFLALVLATKGLSDFFATRLKDAMAGMGTNDNQLIRIIVSRSETDLGGIKTKYQEKYEKTLEEAIESECSGDYKKLLLALIKG